MKLLRYLLRKSPGLVVLAMVTAFFSGVSNASLIALIHKALSNIEPTATLQPGWSFASLGIISLIAALISQLLLSYLYRRAVLDFQMLLSRQILNTSLRQLEKIGNASLLAVLVDDITAIGNSLIPILPLCTNIVFVIICLTYLCWLSWSLFQVVLSLIILGGIVYKVLMSKGQQTLQIAREEISNLFEYFRDLTDGIKELKLHRARSTAFFNQILQPTAASIQRRFWVWSAFYSFTQTWGRFLLLFVTGLILFVLPRFIQLDIQILTGYILTILYIRAMIFSIMNALPAISRANVAFQKIEALGLQLAAELTDNISPLPPVPKLSWQRLELIDVIHFYYREREDNNFTLGPINLTFSPGELTFLIGDNGSGKTTLVKLLAGLYIPEAGEIRLDGKLITDPNREWYRQHFSIVFSDFYLFENLLGLDHPNLNEKANEYLVKLQLDHKVQVKDGNFSTTALSGGQRKRLALLTAYLEDRPFYIFDEWASNQDPMFKEVFYTQFLPELKARGKAVLVISHDDKYFSEADRIVKLNYGKLDYQFPKKSPTYRISKG